MQQRVLLVARFEPLDVDRVASHVVQKRVIPLVFLQRIDVDKHDAIVLLPYDLQENNDIFFKKNQEYVSQSNARIVMLSNRNVRMDRAMSGREI